MESKRIIIKIKKNKELLGIVLFVRNKRNLLRKINHDIKPLLIVYVAFSIYYNAYK